MYMLFSFLLNSFSFFAFLSTQECCQRLCTQHHSRGCRCSSTTGSMTHLCERRQRVLAGTQERCQGLWPQAGADEGQLTPGR